MNQTLIIIGTAVAVSGFVGALVALDHAGEQFTAAYTAQTSDLADEHMTAASDADCAAYWCTGACTIGALISMVGVMW